MPRKHIFRFPDEVEERGFATAQDFMRAFRVSRATVNLWAAEKGLPVYKIGHLLRIPVKQCYEWADVHFRKIA